MNKLINAEWYRFKKCNNLFFWTLILIVFFTYIGFFDSGIIDVKIPVTEGFSDLTGMMSSSIVYVTLIIAFNLAISYENKILHFDMMAGNKISHIIISKVIVTAPIITLFMSLCMGVGCLCGAFVSDIGNAKIVLESIGIFTCINFRIITVSLLIMTIFKGVIGVLAVFVRVTVLDMIPMVIIGVMRENGKNVGNFAKILSGVQYMYLDGSKLNSDFITIVILSMVVEILLMYVLSYFSNKKRAFY